MIVVNTTVRHLLEFRKGVRDIDLEEVKALSGKDFDDYTIGAFTECMTLLTDKGEVAGIGGIQQMDGHPIIWLITTKVIETCQIEFLRFSQKYLKTALEKYGYLGNLAYLKNKMHINWLKWMGAEFLDTQGDFVLFCFMKKDGEAKCAGQQ